MAKSGILGQSKPAATTNTVLYQAPIDSTASAVLTIANDGTGAAYDVAVKEYSQKVTLDASTYYLHEGDVITNHKFALSSPISSDASITPGSTLTSDDGEKTAIFHAFVVPDRTDIFVKDVSLRVITFATGNTGTFAAGDTLSKGSGGDTTTALIYDYYESAGVNYVQIGPSTINGSGTEFADGDTVTSNNSDPGSAVIESGGVGTAEEKFVFSITTAGGVYSKYFLDDLTILSDRTYRFDVSDSSMSGRDFKISTTQNGEWGPDGVIGGQDADDGVEYTTGKTTNGTAGSSGAYVQYDFSGVTTPRFYYYDGGTGTASNANYGGANEDLATSSTYTYDEIFVNDLSTSWTNLSDSFTVDATSFIVNSQTSGKWGYVKEYSGTTLKIIQGPGSGAFAGSDTFQDAPLGSSNSRSLVTISSIDVDTTAIEAQHLLTNGKTNAANNVDRMTSLVIGPGQTLVVESATQNNTFSLIGFEDNSTEITVRNYTASSGGGG